MIFQSLVFAQTVQTPKQAPILLRQIGPPAAVGNKPPAAVPGPAGLEGKGIVQRNIVYFRSNRKPFSGITPCRKSTRKRAKKNLRLESRKGLLFITPIMLNKE
jgi:hypothetical protein